MRWTSWNDFANSPKGQYSMWWGRYKRRSEYTYKGKLYSKGGLRKEGRKKEFVKQILEQKRKNRRRRYRGKLAVEMSINVTEDLREAPGICSVPKAYLDLLYPLGKTRKGGHFLLNDDADIDYLYVEYHKSDSEGLNLTLYPMSCLLEDLKVCKYAPPDFLREETDIWITNSYRFSDDLKNYRKLLVASTPEAKKYKDFLEWDLQRMQLGYARLGFPELAGLLLASNLKKPTTFIESLEVSYLESLKEFIKYAKQKSIELRLESITSKTFSKYFEKELQALVAKMPFLNQKLKWLLGVTILYCPPRLEGRFSKDLDNVMRAIVPSINKVFKAPLLSVRDDFLVEPFPEYGYLSCYEIVKIPHSDWISNKGLLWVIPRGYNPSDGLITRTETKIFEIRNEDF